MRLKITMACDQGKIKFNYNHYLYMTLNRALHRSSTLIPTRYQSALFTFSQLYFDQYFISAEGIHNQGQSVYWYVSSPKFYLLEGMMRGLKANGLINIGDFTMQVQEIEVIGDPDINEVMEFSCMSPITLTSSQEFEGRSRYGRIEDVDFIEYLRKDLISKYYQVHDSLPTDESIDFVFNRHYMKNRRRVTRLVDFNGVKILGYMIPFKVKGNPELIRIGYQLGFGHRNKCGFGMVKVWHQQGNHQDQKIRNVL